MSQESRDVSSGDGGERLQRVLAARGVASRRKAEALIRSGRVSVDGAIVTELGARVDPQRAVIRVDGKTVRPQDFEYVVMHKPSGFITTTRDDRGRRTVMDLLPPGARVYPVGRLDRETEGLLLFTNDGDVANRVMHPRYELTKEYLVLTPRKPPEGVMHRVRAGIEIDGKRVVPHEFRIVRETREGVLLSIVVHEGMNRIVRRLMDAAGIPVEHLRRVRIGPLSIAGISRGSHRALTPGEVASLLESLRITRDAEASATSQSDGPGQTSPSRRRRHTAARKPHRASVA